MVDLESTRRKFSIGLGSVLGVALAGCTSGDSDDPTDTEEPTDTPTEEPTDTPTEEPTETPTPEAEEYTLSVVVQSGSGANPPLEETTVSVDGEEVGETDIDGVVETTVEPGEYSILAEKLRYENGEDEVTVEDDTEVTITLNEVEPDGQVTFALDFQNEGGENVEIGMDVTLSHGESFDVIERSYVGNQDEIDHFSEPYNWKPARMRAPLDDDGEPINIMNPLVPEFAGEWELTVEANEKNEFDTYEDTFEFTEEDLEDEKEIVEHVTLDGAMSEADQWQEQAVVLDGEQHHLETSTDDWVDLYDEDQFAFGYDSDANRVRNEVWDGSDNQLWTFELVGDEDEKWHRIVHEETGDVLTVDESDPAGEGTWGWNKLSLEPWEEIDKQRWRIRPASAYYPDVENDDAYLIEGKHYANDDRFEVGAATQVDLSEDLNGEIATWWYNYDEVQHIDLSPHE